LNLETEIFLIVGTDTEVGKTVFSGLFTQYLMDNGVCVRVVKPFCSGRKEDIDFLQAAHGEGLGQEDLNFWYCDEPISPAAWELRHGQAVDFERAVDWVKSRQWPVGSGKASLQVAGGSPQPSVLLVEGVGGLLAPLAKGRTVSSLGQAIGAQLIVVAPNRVGVINQVLLTVEGAVKRGLKVSCVVLMGQKKPDHSVPENADLIRQNLPQTTGFKGVIEFSYLGPDAPDPSLIPDHAKKAGKTLSQVAELLALSLHSAAGD